jgi:hypothetical protein
LLTDYYINLFYPLIRICQDPTVCDIIKISVGVDIDCTSSSPEIPVVYTAHAITAIDSG